jgi:hypothetical protein
MSVDAALAAILEAWKTAHMRYAEAIEIQKWVSENQMGDSLNATGSVVTDLIEMLKALTAEELKLDMTVKGN